METKTTRQRQTHQWRQAMEAKTATHYWTGRGTLCSLDNNVRQQPNHTPYKADVTCRYCLYQLSLKSPPMSLVP